MFLKVPDPALSSFLQHEHQSHPERVAIKIPKDNAGNAIDFLFMF